MKVNQLPEVSRIEGLVLQESGSADPRTHRVEVQYTGPAPGQEWHALHMPLLDALYLLNLLEEMAKRGGFEHLRRPPAGPTQ